MSESTGRGRPPASSRDILQDAAFDLFLEQSYAHTSVADITQRAGVSRATFFNYFSQKSDVFWVDLDDALQQFQHELTQRSDAGVSGGPAAGIEIVLDALGSLADRLGSHVPFALTQYDLLGSVDELQASALARFSGLARVMTAVLENHGLPHTTARTASYAMTAAALSASQEWADAGTSRGPLRSYLQRAVVPVADAFSRQVVGSE